MTGMVLMHGRAFGNGLEARRLHGQAFPDWNLPDHRAFNAVVQRLRQNGGFRRRTSDWSRQETNQLLNAEPEILNVVEENPGISV